MKKLCKLFLVLAAIAFATNTYAEELGLKMSNLNLYSPAAKEKKSSGGGGIEKGLLQLDVSFTLNRGFSGFYYGHGSRANWWYGSFIRPGVLINFDGAVHKYVSVGGYAGFDASVGKTGYYYATSYASNFAIGFGVRGVFHIYQLISDKANTSVDPGKLDLYAALHLGGNILFGKYIINDSGSRTVYGGPSVGIAVGVRYYFTEKIGVVGQIGYGEMGSLFKAGLAVKL